MTEKNNWFSYIVILKIFLITFPILILYANLGNKLQIKVLKSQQKLFEWPETESDSYWISEQLEWPADWRSIMECSIFIKNSNNRTETTLAKSANAQQEGIART